jgi:hypothetical protein
MRERSSASGSTAPRARLVLIRVETGEELPAQFNPASFDEVIEVAYARHEVPGLSYRPLHYRGTANTTLALELYFSALERGAPDLGDAKRFLQALCYPRQTAEEFGASAPPRVLVVWPNVLSLRCVVTGATFSHEQFNAEGAVTALRAKLTLEEVLPERLMAADVLRFGSRRSPEARFEAEQGGGGGGSAPGDGVLA